MVRHELVWTAEMFLRMETSTSEVPVPDTLEEVVGPTPSPLKLPEIQI